MRSDPMALSGRPTVRHHEETGGAMIMPLFSPFAVLIVYLLRIATVACRTVTNFGQFVLQRDYLRTSQRQQLRDERRSRSQRRSQAFEPAPSNRPRPNDASAHYVLTRDKEGEETTRYLSPMRMRRAYPT